MSSSRREFIKTSAAAGAVVASGVASMVTESVHAVPNESKAKQPIQNPLLQKKAVIYKSVKWGMIGGKLSVLDKFKMMQDLGYDGIELNSPGGANKQHCLEASQKTGMPIHGVVDSKHWGVRLSDPNEVVREKALQDLITAIKDSHYCGGSSVLLVVGHGKDGTPQQVADRSIAQIRKALPLAAKLGVRILLENVWNQFLYKHNGPADQTADETAAYIDRVNSPWFGSYFDIGNHRKYGVPSQWIKTLGNRIVKLDVKDFDHKKNKWAGIGLGTVDWGNVRTELANINFNGWATAEVGGGDRKRLKQIKERMDQVLG